MDTNSGNKAAIPIENTAYGKAVFRIEARPGPQEMVDPALREKIEAPLAEAGVDGRWISIVDPHGVPYLDNAFLPPIQGQDLAENEAVLKAWVDEMHARDQAVMSWYALSIGESANLAHPEWRQVSRVPWYDPDEAQLFCCPETGYGDALINYCIDAIGRLGLDGIWFDGAAWTPIWNRPLPVTCFCETCQTTFKNDTGLGLPTVLDFEDATFRTWVQWRTKRFGSFIEKAARRIREAHPHCAVVINHYHRPGIPWHSAIPIDRFDADIITGSEAFSPKTLDLTHRLNRAYGRSQSEVWRVFELSGSPQETAANLLPHALHSYVAGGRPAFGGDHSKPGMAQAAALMHPIMEAITPFVGGPAVPRVALHVSQQSETFVFARGGDMQNPSDFFWGSLSTWTWALMGCHVSPDYVFDSDFTPEGLSPYGVLLMPLSPALSPEQAEVALDFARRGGTLILGIGAGQRDPFGQPVGTNPFEQELGFQFTRHLDPRNLPIEATRFEPVEDGEALTVNGASTPADFIAPEWKPLFLTDSGRPGIAGRSYGKGAAMVVTADPSRLFGTSPISGGDTELAVTAEKAATGKRSLKFVDGPVAPETFYPDLETNLTVFGVPECSGGVLECDLYLEEGANTIVEIRSRQQPILGPSVRVDTNGAHLSSGGTLPVPVGEWFHLGIIYTFARDGVSSTFRVRVAPRDGTPTEATGTSRQGDFSNTDWLVVFGVGTATGTWYLDNLSLTKTLAGGGSERVLLLDFEDGDDSLQETGALATQVAKFIQTYYPYPVSVDAPASVHAGIFEPEPGRIFVHLYSLDHAIADWQQPTGHPVRIICQFRPSAARMALGETPLDVQRGKLGWEIAVPPIGLYQVVRIER